MKVGKELPGRPKPGAISLTNQNNLGNRPQIQTLNDNSGPVISPSTYPGISVISKEGPNRAKPPIANLQLTAAVAKANLESTFTSVDFAA